jgi:benzoate-CoA ligase
MHIDLPATFNVATHFVDRHIGEGRGEKVAFECGDERVTYRQLLERVNRAGNALRALGLRREERIVLLLYDTPDFAYWFFGAIKAGLVPIPANTLLKPQEYEYVLNDSRARVVVVSEALLPQLQAIAPDKLRYMEKIVVAGKAPQGMDSAQALLDRASPELDAEPTSKDDAAFWLYSSGSTGFPKGCVHLHHDMVVSAELYAKAVLGIREDDRFFSVAKLFFAYGLGNGLYFSLAVGATSILWPGSPSPPNIFGVIERYKPTLFFSVPTNYATLLSYHRESGVEFDLSSVRWGVSAGEQLPAPIYYRLRNALRLRFLMPLVQLKLYICSSPTVPVKCAPAPAARSFPGMKHASWMKTAFRSRRAKSATCSSAATLSAPAIGTSTRRPKTPSRATGSAPATSSIATKTVTTGTLAAPTTC